MLPLQLARELDALEVRHALTNTTGPEQVCPTGPGVTLYLGPDVPLNRIYGLGFEARDADHLTAGEAFLTRHGAPPRVDVTSHADPAFLRALGERGYRLARVMNLFTLDLTGLRSERPDGVQQVDVQQVDVQQVDVQQVDGPTWLSVLPDQPPAEVLRLIAHRQHTTYWAARHDGAWAANATLSVLNGWAVLFATMTRPEFRERGAQTALLRARLHAAREAGLTRAVVQALPGSASERNVLRAGFRLVHTRLLFER